MKINVTREDIRNGKAGKPTECMVALALKRELGISYASVGYRDAKILVDGQYVKLYFPKSVEKKIRFWDGFHFVFPFSFGTPAGGFPVRLDNHIAGSEHPSRPWFDLQFASNRLKRSLLAQRSKRRPAQLLLHRYEHLIHSYRQHFR